MALPIGLSEKHLLAVEIIAHAASWVIGMNLQWLMNNRADDALAETKS